MTVMRTPGSDTSAWQPLEVGQPVLWMELQRSSVVAAGGGEMTVEVVRVIGEVDMTTAGQLASALAELVARPDARVVVDATRMTFCGLRGLGALHDGARLADTQGAGFAIVGLSAQLTRLSQELWPAPHPTVFPDRAGAVASVVTGARASRSRPVRLLEPR